MEFSKRTGARWSGTEVGKSKQKRKQESVCVSGSSNTEPMKTIVPRVNHHSDAYLMMESGKLFRGAHILTQCWITGVSAKLLLGGGRC